MYRKIINKKPWIKYSIGTRAFSLSGGFWERVKDGWKWCCGDVFPTPGADVFKIIEPVKRGDGK